MSTPTSRFRSFTWDGIHLFPLFHWGEMLLLQPSEGGFTGPQPCESSNAPGVLLSIRSAGTPPNHPAEGFIQNHPVVMTFALCPPTSDPRV